MEGACPGSAGVATDDGHSVDETLAVLRRFQLEEDPDHKLTVVIAEDEGHPDGFWPGEKDEMSQAYARRATGDYLWQVDVDEFYLEQDMPKIMALLVDGVDEVSFPTLHFWGSPNYVADGFHMICNGFREYHRLFRWGPGYTYTAHRPPQVADTDGVDLRDKLWLRADEMARREVFMYHYSFLFPHQVLNKVCYYATPSEAGNGQHRVLAEVGPWEERTYLRLKRPFRVHIVQDHISWLYRFRGSQPIQVDAMMKDVSEGRCPVETRDCGDVEVLLHEWWYRISVALLRSAAAFIATPSGKRLSYRFAQCRYVLRLIRERELVRTARARWAKSSDADCPPTT